MNEPMPASPSRHESRGGSSAVDATADVPERRNFVGGHFVDSPRPFLKISPVDGTPVARVYEADRSLVDAAVQAARRAVSGDWGRTTVVERGRYLEAIAAGIERRLDEFVAAEVQDTGKPVAVAKTLDVPRAIANFRVFAEVSRTTGLEAYGPDAGSSALNYAIRRPLGVVGVIAPWNLPLLLLTWKVAPALACGNAVVAKPSEESPSSATLLAEVVAEAGVPPGVFNVVHGFGPQSAGEFITTHPGVDAVTFTGESATGADIMRAVAPTVKPISFELGGKNAAIVFADADFDAAVAGVAQSVFANCGQVCLCTERVYVERPIFDRFVAALVGEAKRLHLGWPSDPATTLGPLISPAHRAKVLRYFALAQNEGATVLTGGGVPTFGDARDGGSYIEPTIWVDLPETARCMKEEVFGPVCHIAPFDAEAEAVALANDNPYGLASAIWTTNLSRAHRVAHQMHTGLAWVNCWYLRDLRTPFGGMKLSGIGREGGRHSLDFYSAMVNVCIRI